MQIALLLIALPLFIRCRETRKSKKLLQVTTEVFFRPANTNVSPDSLGMFFVQRDYVSLQNNLFLVSVFSHLRNWFYQRVLFTGLAAFKYFPCSHSFLKHHREVKRHLDFGWWLLTDIRYKK